MAKTPFSSKGELSVDISSFPGALFQDMIKNRVRPNQSRLTLQLQRLWVPDGFVVDMQPDQEATIKFSFSARDTIITIEENNVEAGPEPAS